jgi:hypothetical protein
MSSSICSRVLKSLSTLVSRSWYRPSEFSIRLWAFVNCIQTLARYLWGTPSIGLAKEFTLLYLFERIFLALKISHWEILYEFSEESSIVLDGAASLADNTFRIACRFDYLNLVQKQTPRYNRNSEMNRSWKLEADFLLVTVSPCAMSH